MGTIDVPSNAILLKIIFNPSHYDHFNYPDLVLISPNREEDWYDSVKFGEDGYGDVQGTDGNGNSYTGYLSDPEVMEINNPAQGIWMVGVYLQYDGDVFYTLESNFNIVQSAGEFIFKEEDPDDEEDHEDDDENEDEEDSEEEEDHEDDEDDEVDEDGIHDY